MVGQKMIVPLSKFAVAYSRSRRVISIAANPSCAELEGSAIVLGITRPCYNLYNYSLKYIPILSPCHR
jgi:hypothetical protein